jgi:hypothetical protein
MDVPLEKVPFLQFENHRVYALSPGPFGCECKKMNLAEELLQGGGEEKEMEGMGTVDKVLIEQLGTKE